MNTAMKDHLQTQLSNFQKMQQCMQEQHSCLIVNDDTGFQSAVGKAEALMNEIKRIYRSIAKQLSDNGDDEVKQLRQQIKQTVLELKKQNKVNETLLNNRMNFINYNINVAAQATAGISYQPGGSGQAGAQKIKMFDQSI